MQNFLCNCWINYQFLHLNYFLLIKAHFVNIRLLLKTVWPNLSELLNHATFRSKNFHFLGNLKSVGFQFLLSIKSTIILDFLMRHPYRLPKPHFLQLFLHYKHWPINLLYQYLCYFKTFTITISCLYFLSALSLFAHLSMQLTLISDSLASSYIISWLNHFAFLFSSTAATLSNNWFHSEVYG
jgi:hypothetical protein